MADVIRDVVDHFTNNRGFYMLLSHCATALGSKRTHVPMRNEGIRPTFACLKTVIFETFSI